MTETKPSYRSGETYGVAAVFAGLFKLAQGASDSVVITCVIVAGAVALGFAVVRSIAKSVSAQPPYRGVPNTPHTTAPPLPHPSKSAWYDPPTTDPPPPPPAPPSAAAPLILGAALLFMVGCATPSAINEIGTEGPRAQGSPVSMATMDGEGLQVGSYQGAAPTNIKQDGDGAWVTTPGQGGATVLTMPNGVSAYIWSPKDGTVGSIAVTGAADGVFTLEIVDLAFNISTHAGIVATMYADAMDAIKDMTRAEAERRVAELKAAGEITATVAEAILSAYVPTLPIE